MKLEPAGLVRVSNSAAALLQKLETTTSRIDPGTPIAPYLKTLAHLRDIARILARDLGLEGSVAAEVIDAGARPGADSVQAHLEAAGRHAQAAAENIQASYGALVRLLRNQDPGESANAGMVKLVHSADSALTEFESELVDASRAHSAPTQAVIAGHAQVTHDLAVILASLGRVTDHVVEGIGQAFNRSTEDWPRRYGTRVTGPLHESGPHLRVATRKANGGYQAAVDAQMTHPTPAT